MRLLALAAAALLTTGVIAASPAAAQPRGWHGGSHHGWHGGHRRCRTTWRHHHRVRRCW